MGSGRPADGAPGVTVTVTVGAGRGRIETRGLCVGTCTTMPTTPSAVKSADGRTRADWVSALALRCTETTVPTGTPGTRG